MSNWPLLVVISSDSSIPAFKDVRGIFFSTYLLFPPRKISSAFRTEGSYHFHCFLSCANALSWGKPLDSSMSKSRITFRIRAPRGIFLPFRPPSGWSEPSNRLSWKAMMSATGCMRGILAIRFAAMPGCMSKSWLSSGVSCWP